MDVILVRYAEVGLKSPSVRRYFETVLVDNMLASLAQSGLEALVDSAQGRIYVTTDRIDEAAAVLKRVFGVASLSPAFITGSEMAEMQEAAAKYSLTVLKDRQTFAVKARREGNHPYRSMDVGREVGSAIFLANEDRGVKVNLSDPDVTFYVEVRGKKAYMFSEYIPGPGGLPMGSQGKVVAVVDSERDALAAWMLMKRGCRVTIVSSSKEGPAKILEKWAPNLKVVEDRSVEEVLRNRKASAVVFGYGLGDMDKIKEVRFEQPAFYPLIGMSEEEIAERLASIKTS